MRILIVEDEFLIAAYLEDVLGELGYQDIFTAHSLEAARAHIQASPPEFAILDVNIGRNLVFPVAESLEVEEIPFLFSTGQRTDSFPLKWRQYPVLPKPAKSAELAKLIANFDFGTFAAPALKQSA